MPIMRLDKLLSECGVASRKEIRQLIKSGRVSVDGAAASSPEMRKMGLFPVGRLDKDTTGLLLLTNDGDFAHRVISPKSGIVKVYHARTEAPVDEADVAAFEAGLTLGDGTKCLPAGLKPLPDGSCLVEVMEGKYHQVKRMLASRGKPVTELKRLSIGGLKLDESLLPGDFRALEQNELCSVMNKK